MSRTDEPIRLRSMVARGSVLERGLEAAQSSGPTDEQLRALERRVLAGLGVAAGAVVVVAKGAESHVLGSATGWLAAGTTKLVVALVATVAVGGGAVVAWQATGKRSHGHPAVAMPTQVAAISSEPRLQPELPAMPVASAPVSQVPLSNPVAAAGAPVARKHESLKTAASKTAQGAADEEFSLLERANRALAKSPALALSLAGELARRFPACVMDQEREVITITALVDLGKTDAAQKRAVRFSRAHPSSVYQGRIDKALTARPQGQP